ncbi:hypothetical protein CRG98_005522 [Punica granatum]|uniref:PDZ domain-containing protein n=1 Tax=Punica granatum TaxID=22663 RepID=A0A2I0KZY8_PUNGR|nr:hypothetical protein CRG98_005522 [Punica granatum]
MKLLLSKILTAHGRNSLLRIAAAAAAGSGLLYASSHSKCPTRLSVSIHLPLTNQVKLPCPAFPSSDHGLTGTLPWFSFRSSPFPSDDVNNAISPDTGASAKPCSGGCLGRDTIANAAARVGPAVVNLSVPQGFFGIPVGKNIGSGTIIDKDGTILTCAHVVVDFQGPRSPSTGKVAVTLQDGRMFEGTVTNADIHSDIAIVKINSKAPLPTAKLGSSSRLRPGDWVLSVGCPLSLQNTVTAGIVRWRVVRPWLGLKMVDLNEMVIAQLKERDPTFPNVGKGVLVVTVTPGSPADRAGILPGDVVVEFDGKPVESISEIIEIMGDHIGVPMMVVVKRAKDRVVTLTATPDESCPDI